MEFVELEKRIKKETTNSKIINLIEKVITWEKQRIDSDRPRGAIEDFRYFIQKEFKENDNS